MKNPFIGLAVVGLTLLLASGFFRGAANPSTLPTGPETPVVVELFTSEGCSSCPPADALLARLEEGQNAGNAQVIALEEHVDYWNDLGWRDPFSSSEWTTRQYAYARSLGNGNAYTPQMVVDGTVEFVGSHSQKARETIAKAASGNKTPILLMQGSSNAADVEEFTVKVGKLEGTSRGDAAEVWLAITEAGLHSAVTRGENAGEDLHHASIVRTMRKIGEAKTGGGEASFAGNASVRLKKEWKRDSLKAVVFVQEERSRRILGAAEIRVAQ
jgi:hypothetical protein